MFFAFSGGIASIRLLYPRLVRAIQNPVESGEMSEKFVLDWFSSVQHGNQLRRSQQQYRESARPPKKKGCESYSPHGGEGFFSSKNAVFSNSKTKKNGKKFSNFHRREHLTLLHIM